ncbi:MAG: FHA domain-containing protein, partial [Myxococcaceae bacterium]
SPDATRAGPPLKLEIVSGPDSGKSKMFKGVRMVIGRTAGCEWKLSDPSASRRHCELVVGDGGVLLRDLGSGNGTKVNGEKVKEKKLEHGDEIAIGKTVIRFIDEVAAFRKAREEAEAKDKQEKEAAAAPAQSDEQPKPVDLQKNLPTDAMGSMPAKTEQRPAMNARRPDAPPTGIFATWQGLEKRLQYAIIGGAGFLAFIFILALVLSSGKPVPPPPDPKIERAALKMQKAKNAARDGKFEEAAALAAEAEKLVPGTDSDGLAARAAQEAASLKLLESAQKMMDDNRFDEAKAELARASFMTDSGIDAKKKLSADLDGKYLAWLKGQADTAIEAKEYDNAKALVGKMPPTEQRPYNQKLIALQQTLDAEAKDQELQQKKQVKQQKQHAAAQRQAYVEAAFEAVERKFNGGDYQRASLECDRVVEAHRGDNAIRERAAELKRLIPQFGKAYEDGQKKFKAGSLEAAARPLKKARELYAQIGFEGSLGKILDDELASAALQAAVSSYAREDYPSAALYYRQALKLNPTDDRAKDGLSKVNKRADELYLQAYMIRDREPKEAIAKLRVVVQLAEDNGVLMKKAKDLLAQME